MAFYINSAEFARRRRIKAIYHIKISVYERMSSSSLFALHAYAVAHHQSPSAHRLIVRWRRFKLLFLAASATYLLSGGGVVASGGNKWLPDQRHQSYRIRYIGGHPAARGVEKSSLLRMSMWRSVAYS